MFTSYCRIAWRNLTRNKTSSYINILGLAIGMAVAMLNGLWIWDELSFNHYHDNYKKIARVMSIQSHNDEQGYNDGMSYPVGTELRTTYRSSFKYVVRYSWPVNDILSTGDKKISGSGIFMDDEGPEMLTLRMRYGSRDGLKDPHAVLLAASMSTALFGNTSPLGKTLLLNNKTPVKIAGVYEDLPLNSQFCNYKFLGAFEAWVAENDWIEKSAQHDWSNHFIRIYVQIPAGSTFTQMNAVIKDLERRHKAEFKTDSYSTVLNFLHPMDQWHLHPYSRGKADPAAIHMVRLVALIGGIVLLLACINFMNLSTARSEKRAKEVGIRKTIGSARGQLIGQFFSESFMVVLFAFLLSLLLLLTSLSWFNDLAAKNMSVPWTNPWFWTMSLLFIIVTGLLAGSYPALYLSSFKPVKVLKGHFRAGRLAAIPRKVLVVLQFTVSVSLIICTIIVYRQIQHGRDRPVGYTREGLIGMEMKSGDFYEKFALLREELKKSGAVTEMSGSMGNVTDLWSNNNGFTWKGMNPALEQSFGTLAVTSTHGATVGWQFIMGRDFNSAISSDSMGIVMNETAMRYMGLQNPIGEPVGWKFSGTDSTFHYTVLGVIKDMVMESPYEPVKPTLFFIRSLNGGVNYINIRLASNIGTATALDKIEKVFRKIIPSAPFEYKFTDEEYARKFAAEERIGKLAAFFGSLAVFISCLGLFGLAAFVASQRTKEIGVRRVLGASIFHLWQLLSKEFVQLVILSCALAIPIAWYCMHQWMQNYTYRTDIAWWIFAATGLGALGISLMTVSFQSISTAMNNPINSLKSE